MAIRGRKIWDNKEWTKTLVLATDEFLFHFHYMRNFYYYSQLFERKSHHIYNLIFWVQLGFQIFFPLKVLSFFLFYRCQ
jgi:hypothetical protein